MYAGEAGGSLVSMQLLLMEVQDVRQLLVQAVQLSLLAAVTKTNLQIVQSVNPAWRINSSDMSGSFF